jgi:uncharacterized protein (TIGR02265 family)
LRRGRVAVNRWTKAAQSANFSIVLELSDLPPDAFQPVDYARPLDVKAVYDAVPRTASVRGMFFHDLQHLLGDKLPGTPLESEFKPLKDYPLVEFCRGCVFTAETVFADQPLREGLRRVGRHAFPRMAKTKLGKLTFGIFGKNLTGVGSAAAKGYRLATRPGEIRVMDLGSNHGIFHLREIYNFADCLQPGVFEGAMLAVGREGVVTTHPIGIAEILIKAEWA